MTDVALEIPEDSGAIPTNSSLQKGTRAWSRIARDLTTEDLSSHGAQKLILDELERLSRENDSISTMRDQLHAEEIKNAKLKGQLDTKMSVEMISLATSSAGSLLVGLAPSIYPVQALASIIIGVIGGALVIAGFLAKKVK